MKDTASVKIYHINSDVNSTDLCMFIEKLNYKSLGAREEPQQANGIQIFAYAREDYTPPDWVSLVKYYIKDSTFIDYFKKYDLIFLFKRDISEKQSHVFAYCCGSGYFSIEKFIDQTFGISILECVFDPTQNKIKALTEKGIVGDILASHRYYRWPRPVAYEDDFGRYFQGINTQLTDQQIKQKFPKFAQRMGNRLRPKISITGSASIEIQMRLDFIALIYLVKDLSELLLVQPQPIFNKTLSPLNIKKQKTLINFLYDLVFAKLVEDYFNKTQTFDYEFCPRDFEEFYSSVSCQFDFEGMTNIGGIQLAPFEVDDIYDLSNRSYLNKLITEIESSVQCKQSKSKQEFIKIALQSSIYVSTVDGNGRHTAPGKLAEYLQLEIQNDGTSYFLLDRRWYLLKPGFDNNLKEKYLGRVKNKFQKHNFILKWSGHNEEEYNQQYNAQPNSFYLHLIKVDNIELSDALFVDDEDNKIYFIHVKDGVGAPIRDLVSQVSISTRIIEEEVKTGKHDNIEKLYQQAVANGRINGNVVPQERFVDWITKYRREYVLAVHDTKDTKDIIEGNFTSRIAKFALIEFASFMSTNGWDFSICCIPYTPESKV